MAGRAQCSSFFSTGPPSIVVNRKSTTQQGPTLLVGESDTITGALAVKAIRRLENPNKRQNGEGEGGPVNETAKV